MATAAATGSARFSPLAYLSAKLQRLNARRLKGRVYRQIVRELSQLTSRELNDIGISACDIHDVARKGAGLQTAQ